MADAHTPSQTPESELSERDVREVGRSTLDVRNRDDTPIYVRVSKTLGRGQDGYFKIDPGQSERWARHVGRRVTIDLSLFGDDNVDASISHQMGISSGDNKFEMNGGRFRQVTRNFERKTLPQSLALGESKDNYTGGRELSFPPYPSWAPTAFPPAVAFPVASGFDIGAVERAARQAIRSASQGVDAVIRDSVDDIRAIWDSTSACLGEIDEIRVRISNRAIQNHTLAIRTLVDAGVIPVQLIEKVWRRVAPDLVRPVNPRLFRLLNPGPAVWGSQPPNLVEVTDTASIELNPDSRSLFFVHGMDYRADRNEAYQDMYRLFEQEVRMFQEDTSDCKNRACKVYLLSYDSKLTDEQDTIIRLGFEAELGGPVIGSAPGLFLAVLWREMERRAQVAGDHLYTLLSPLPRGIDNGLFLFSHSLGCFACAHMANRLYSENPGDGALFRSWYCMAAAIPANGFQRSGVFPYAPFIASGIDPRTKVYYSFFDNVVSTAYVLANGHLGMGNVGSGVRRPDTSIRNIDTTALSREVHGPTVGYFSRVGELIRRDFGIS